MRMFRTVGSAVVALYDGWPGFGNNRVLAPWCYRCGNKENQDQREGAHIHCQKSGIPESLAWKNSSVKTSCSVTMMATAGARQFSVHPSVAKTSAERNGERGAFDPCC